MCTVCLASQCLSGCPNEIEYQAESTCEFCGNGIYPGDEYVCIDSDNYHLDCLDFSNQKTASKLLSITHRMADNETCGICHQEIEEELAELDGETYHPDCLFYEMRTSELLELAGEVVRTAQEDDGW